MLKKLLFIALLFGINEACKKKTPVKETLINAQLPEDFKDFYAKFHEDTSYQMKHIEFPVKGLPQDVDSTTLAEDDFFYTRDVWQIHKPIDFTDGEFQREFRLLSDRMIIEDIIKSDKTFSLERRFAKKSDAEWYLIYYIAPNHFTRGR